VQTLRPNRPVGADDIPVLDGAEGNDGPTPRVSARLSRVTKLKSCKWCRTLFVPQYNRVQPTCSPTCAIAYTRAKQAKEALQEARRAKLEYRRKSIPLSKLKSQAQRECNSYIRERDFGKPCISCGRKTGAQMHAGHYRTTKAAEHLRFNEDNNNLQCEHCNTYLSGNIVEYRKGLIAKYGVERVEALENSNEVKRWEREELIAIRKEFLGRWKALKAAREAT
jgi:hypothetical protein